MRARRNRRLDLSELSAKEVADDQTPLAKGGTGGESAATVTGWNGFHVSICQWLQGREKGGSIPSVAFRWIPDRSGDRSARAMFSHKETGRTELAVVQLDRTTALCRR